MATKTLLPVLGLAAACLLVVPGSSSAGTEVNARCSLFHQPSVNAEGPCTVYREGNIVTVKGTLQDIKNPTKTSPQKFVAVLDKSKDEGLLTGADFFALANGALDDDRDNIVEWPNGYILKIVVEKKNQ